MLLLETSSPPSCQAIRAVLLETSRPSSPQVTRAVLLHLPGHRWAWCHGMILQRWGFGCDDTLKDLGLLSHSGN